MKLLLDTHAFISWDQNPEKLSEVAHSACFDPQNDLVLSAASVWEMQIKAAIGKLTLRKPLRQLINDQIQQNGLGILPVTLDHTLRLDSLPSHHKDPFDRMLVAQALTESWQLITHDPMLGKYPIQVVW